MKDGVLFINKPSGLTSRDVVNKIVKIYQTKKVGHTGTLDPLATGVLIVCLGKYTKLVEELTSKEKEYIATMQLGIETDTLDTTGQVLKTKGVTVSKEKVLKSFKNFPTTYMQTVPMYSAVKINGKKLYEYAREKETVSLPKREVTIKNLNIIKYEEKEITFKVTVSKGTYIRSLIKDLAASFNELAVMSALSRTKQGNVSLAECLELDQITSNTPLKTIKDLFSYPEVTVDEETKKKVLNGNIIKLNTTEPRVFITYQKTILAIYEKQSSFYHLVFKNC